MENKITQTISELKDTVKDVCIDNNDGNATARKTLLANNSLTSFAQSITTGAFFTTLMLSMGADNTYIGYISMATSISCIAQFFAPLFWERIRIRKPLIIISLAISHLLTYGGLTVIPIFPVSNSIKLLLFMITTIVSGILFNFKSPAENAWAMQSIPLTKRVNFTSLSLIFQMIINVTCSFIAGIFTDRMETENISLGSLSPALTAIIILRGIAFIAIMTGVLLFALKVKELPYATTDEQKQNVGISLLFIPLKDSKYMMTIAIPCFRFLFQGIINNYFYLHLVENVKMSYTLISSAQIISTPVILIFTSVWTLILKRLSWMKALGIALLGYSVAYTCNVFISSETLFFYFAAIIIGHIFDPCLNLANSSLIYYHMPESNRTPYFSAYTLLINAATFIGQAIGTIFVKYSENLHFVWFGIDICNLQFVSVISTVGVIFVAVYAFFYDAYLKKHQCCNI